jgi:hypothetical protein
MILSSHGIIGSSIVQFDPDAAAFFARVTAAGGTLSATEKTAVNQLVLDMKDDGIWTPMKAIYPMVGASAAACAQNLKSSSFTGSFTATGWTFASTGVKGDGIVASMNTNLIANTSLSLNSGHLSIYSRTNVEESSCDLGGDSGAGLALVSPEQLILTRFTGLGFSQVYGTYNGQVANADSRGHFITNRNSLTNVTGYKNGVNVRDIAQTTGLSTRNIHLGSESGVVRFSTREYAFASIGDGLTDDQADDFYTAVQAFQTTLNREIAP